MLVRAAPQAKLYGDNALQQAEVHVTIFFNMLHKYTTGNSLKSFNMSDVKQSTTAEPYIIAQAHPPAYLARTSISMLLCIILHYTTL